MPYIPLPHSARSGADMPSIPHTPGMHSSARVPQAPNLPAAAVSPNVPHIEIGHLVVFVTAADGAIPLENALVTVSALSQNGVSELLFTTRTNKSGRTTTLPLPAPPRSNSLSPGGKNCCAQYTVSVDHDDFHSVVYSNIVKRPAKGEKAKSPKSLRYRAFRGFLTKDTNGEKVHRADMKPDFVRKI